MFLNCNKIASSCIIAHIHTLLRSDGPASDEERTVARTTNALPVYSDWSGSLAVTPDGEVLFYDSESGQVTPVTDDAWSIVAAVSAAQKYPDLRDMLPDRPPTAKSCGVCSGTGRQMPGKAFCGKCSGLGWIG